MFTTYNYTDIISRQRLLCIYYFLIRYLIRNCKYVILFSITNRIKSLKKVFKQKHAVNCRFRSYEKIINCILFFNCA